MTDGIMTGAADMAGGNAPTTTTAEDVAPQDETMAAGEVPPGDRAEPLPQDVGFEAQMKANEAAIDPVADLRQVVDKLTARVEKLEADTAAYHASLEAAGIVRPFTTATVDEPPQGQ